MGTIFPLFAAAALDSPQSDATVREPHRAAVLAAASA
jgi:hypothetical protein